MKFFKISHDTSIVNEEQRLAKWVQDEIKLESIVCPINEGHQRAGRRISNLSIVLPNPPLEDFVWTWHSECLIRDHVLGLFRSKGLVGFDVKPVKARFKRGAYEPPTLWELVTESRVRAATAAGLYVKDRCEACASVLYSVYEHGLPVDESTWDGSDFFHFEEWGGLFVTERVRDFVIEQGLTGTSFVQVENLRWPEGVIKP